jgi:hypothetical protein
MAPHMTMITTVRNCDDDGLQRGSQHDNEDDKELLMMMFRKQTLVLI